MHVSIIYNAKYVTQSQYTFLFRIKMAILIIFSIWHSPVDDLWTNIFVFTCDVIVIIIYHETQPYEHRLPVLFTCALLYFCIKDNIIQSQFLNFMEINKLQTFHSRCSNLLYCAHCVHTDYIIMTSMYYVLFVI